MCICILKPKNKAIPLEVLKQCYDNNPDGVGLLYLDYCSGQLRSFITYVKGCFSWRKFLNNYNLVKLNYDLVLHFRTAASSGYGYDYCHPFMVNEKLGFVHNGNLFEFSSYFKGRKRDNLIDTQRFNKEILQKLPSNFLEIRAIRNILEEYCKFNMSKMIFLNSSGKYYIINEEAGIWKDSCWFSNGGMDNYNGYGFSGAYEYNKEDIRHKGGLPTIQMFSEKRRKNWIQCKKCGGYYKIKYIKNSLCQGCSILRKFKSFIIK